MCVFVWCVCVCECLFMCGVCVHIHACVCLPACLSVCSYAYLRMFACMSDLSLDVKVGR